MCRHGDMLYLDIQSDVAAQMITSESPVAAGNGVVAAPTADHDLRPLSSSFNREGIAEDEVDQFMWKQDGRIARERNEQL